MIIDDTYNYGLIDLMEPYTLPLLSFSPSVHDGKDIDLLLNFFLLLLFIYLYIIDMRLKLTCRTCRNLWGCLQSQRP